MSEENTNENLPPPPPPSPEPEIPVFPIDRIEKGEKPSGEELKKG